MEDLRPAYDMDRWEDAKRDGEARVQHAAHVMERKLQPFRDALDQAQQDYEDAAEPLWYEYDQVVYEARQHAEQVFQECWTAEMARQAEHNNFVVELLKTISTEGEGAATALLEAKIAEQEKDLTTAE